MASYKDDKIMQNTPRRGRSNTKTQKIQHSRTKTADQTILREK